MSLRTKRIQLVTVVMARLCLQEEEGGGRRGGKSDEEIVRVEKDGKKRRNRDGREGIERRALETKGEKKKTNEEQKRLQEVKEKIAQKNRRKVIKDHMEKSEDSEN